jgi:hypothetical protein
MKAMDNIIQRQIMKVRLPSRRDATEIENRIGVLCQMDIAHILDEVCARVVPPDVHLRIDEMEIDLGSLCLGRLESELIEKVRSRFEEELVNSWHRAQSNQAGFAHAEDTVWRETEMRGQAALSPSRHPDRALSEVEYRLDLLRCFLQHGRLAWWTETGRVGRMEDVLSELLGEAPAQLRVLVEEEIRNDRARRRLIFQFSDQSISAVVELLGSGSRRWIAGWVGDLTRVHRHVSMWRLAELEFRFLIWEAIFAQTRPQQSTQLTESRLVECVVEAVSQRCGQSYQSVLVAMQSAFRRLSASRTRLESSLAKSVDQCVRQLRRRLGLEGQFRETMRPIAGLSLATSPPPPTSPQGFPDGPQGTNSAPDGGGARNRNIDRRPDDSLRVEEPGRPDELGSPRMPAELAEAGKPVYARAGDRTADGFESPRMPAELAEAGKPVYARAGDWTTDGSGVQERIRTDGPANIRAPAKAADKKTSTDLVLGDTRSLSEESWPQTSVGTPGICVENAGLVLLWPYLSRYFEQVGLIEDSSFRDETAQMRAIHLLQYLATGQEETLECFLVLNKLLCGWNVDEPVSKKITTSESEKAESQHLLSTVISHWSALKNTTVQGLRTCFLQRRGSLAEYDENWLLRVECRAYDLLLGRLPWTISVVKLSWMKKVLSVEWWE